MGIPDRWLRWLGAAAILVAASLGPDVIAAPPHALLGEAWEEPILEGIRAQEQALKDRTPQAILVDAKAKAARRADAPTTVARQYLLARAYGLAGDQASARSVYGEVLRLAPRCYFAWRDLGILDSQKSPPDAAGAERSFRQALAVNPAYGDAARGLSVLLIEAKRDADALPFLQRVVEAEPADVQARLILVRTLGRLKRFQEARQQVDLLRRREPTNPTFRDVEAELVLTQGDAAKARDLYRQLAADFPTEPMPLVGYLRCLDVLAKATGKPDPEEYLWAIERLVRLERDPAIKKKLAETRDSIRAAMARQQQPGTGAGDGPPTDAQLLQVLRGPDPEGRLAALRYTFAQEKPPTADLLKAVMERLDAAREPSPSARQWALRVLARFGGYGLAGLARHSLADPDPSVRVTAVDTLMALAEQDASARGAAVLVLGPLAASPGPTPAADATLAAVSRMAVLQLARGELAEDAATEPARRAAFAAWWNGPIGSETKIRSLEAFPRLKDRMPETVLLPYLEDADFGVFLATYRALQSSSASALPGPRAAWWRAFPAVAQDQLVPAQRAAVGGRLKAWAAGRPR